MQPETLDPVIELRDAISFMLGAAQRMALLDEHGRIAMINPAWREAAREDSRSIAALGRGVHFLDLCDEYGLWVVDEANAREVEVSIMPGASETTWVTVDMVAGTFETKVYRAPD